MLIKNKIPGNFRVWAKTPKDEIDVLIKKDLLREPFAPYVEFSPISEEDEYRRQDSLVKLVQAMIYTPEFAWTQMSNVDPAKMAKDVEKARLKASPMYNQLKDQYLGTLFQQAMAQAGFPPPMQQVAGQPQQEASPEGGQRGMTTDIREVAPIGSSEEMQNEIARRQREGRSGIQTQGRGGGGNR